MNASIPAPNSADRNKLAALLSILPGLGHLYKHHYAVGIGLLVGGNILTGFISVLMALGTFGLSILIVPLLYIAAVAASAYSLPDWHGHHHYLHPWTPEQLDAKDLSESAPSSAPARQTEGSQSA
jgi:hypothetical protein